MKIIVDIFWLNNRHPTIRIITDRIFRTGLRRCLSISTRTTHPTKLLLVRVRASNTRKTESVKITIPHRCLCVDVFIDS